MVFFNERLFAFFFSGLTCLKSSRNPSFLKLLMDLVSVDKRVLNFSLRSSSGESFISDTLSVENISPDRVAFKVKTTNQARYIVRPNVGTIDAKSTTTIYIGVQPSSDLPPPGQSKDKFLLRVTSCPGTGSLPDDFWGFRENDSTGAGLKFRVTFDENISQQPSPSLPNDNTYHPDISRPAPVLSSKTQQVPIQRDTQPISSPAAIHSTIATAPHARDLPPDLVPGAVANSSADVKNETMPISSMTSGQLLSESPIAATVPAASENPKEVTLGDTSMLLTPEKYEEAMAKVTELQSMLNEKTLEVSRLKTELAETRAETNRVLKEAPVTPIASNKIVTDPFGGVSVAGLGLLLIVVLLLVNVVLRIV